MEKTKKDKNKNSNLNFQQHRSGELLLLDTVRSKLFQSTSAYEVYRPFEDTAAEGELLAPSMMKIAEARAIERNDYMAFESTRVLGNHIVMRRPGSTSTLVAFEYESSSSPTADLEAEKESGILQRLLPL